MRWPQLRIVLFVGVAVIQLVVAGAAIFRSEIALRSGEVYRFRVQPVDPIDAFRGRYVAIRLANNRAPAAADFDLKRGNQVFVPIVVDRDGYADFGLASLEAPADADYLRLLSGGVYPDGEGNRWVSLSLTPFGRYYMDERLAPEAERAVWRAPRGQRNASITVRVRNGYGVLEELWIEDTPVLEWLEENAEGLR